MLTRRRLIQSGLTTAAAVSFGPAFWRDAFAAPPVATESGPYSPLLAPDINGLRLPPGFSSRVIAQSNLPVAATGYVSRSSPDGAATFPLPDGGSILAVNSEVPGGLGGASAIRFDRPAPSPRRTASWAARAQLRRRRDSLGHVAVV